MLSRLIAIIESQPFQPEQQKAGVDTYKGKRRITQGIVLPRRSVEPAGLKITPPNPKRLLKRALVVLIPFRLALLRELFT